MSERRSDWWQVWKDCRNRHYQDCALAIRYRTEATWRAPGGSERSWRAAKMREAERHALLAEKADERVSAAIRRALAKSRRRRQERETNTTESRSIPPNPTA